MMVYTLTEEFSEDITPAVGPNTDIPGGGTIRVAYFDVQDYNFTKEQAELIERELEY